MSIQTQHSISHLLYVSSVPIVYRKGGVIFKIKISFNIYQEKKAGDVRGKHQRNSSLRSCGHNPHISVLTEQSVTIKNKEKNANLYNPIKKGRTLISNK